MDLTPDIVLGCMDMAVYSHTCEVWEYFTYLIFACGEYSCTQYYIIVSICSKC